MFVRLLLAMLSFVASSFVGALPCMLMGAASVNDCLSHTLSSAIALAIGAGLAFAMRVVLVACSVGLFSLPAMIGRYALFFGVTTGSEWLVVIGGLVLFATIGCVLAVAYEQAFA